MTDKWVDFKAVKAAVSMEMALGRYAVQVRRSNQFYLRGKCPLPTHKTGDRTPSFGVNTAKNAWACQSQSCVAARGGSKGGNVLDFVAVMEGCSIRDAALRLHEWFPTESGEVSQTKKQPDSEGQRVAQENEPTATNNASANPLLSFTLTGVDGTHPYVISRGISKETAETFGVGYFPGRGSMNRRVVIPIHNVRGELVAYAGRAIDDTEPRYKLPANFKKAIELFNLCRAVESSNDASRRVIVVEGFFDVMKVWQAGYHSVVALMGSSLSDRQQELLTANFDAVALMLDGDEAGKSAQEEIASRLARKLWVRIVEVPEGTQPDQLAVEEIQRILASL
jgi:DNA primase